MSKWISVKDRLPEDFEPVLLFIPKDFPFPTVHEGYLACDGKFYTHELFLKDDARKVTHWMPLPEPPEGE